MSILSQPKINNMKPKTQEQAETVIAVLKTPRDNNSFMDAELLSYFCNCNERQLRKLIEQIREQDLATGYVLVSSDKGYKLTKDANEIESFLNRYLGAAFTQIKVAKAAKKFLTRQQVDLIQTKLEL